MEFTTSALFYVMVGAATSVAVAMRSQSSVRSFRVLQVTAAVLFWPLFIPLLLERQDDAGCHNGASPADPPARPLDAIARSIGQVELELETALRSLDGWAESALDGAEEKLGELRAAWHHQADRIRELDRLLAEPVFQAPTAAASSGLTDEDVVKEVERVADAERARAENLQRLREVRRQLYRDLMSTLAWVRELVTMIHLARYTGAPASRAHELVSQMAAAVEGLREVSEWKCEV